MDIINIKQGIREIMDSIGIYMEQVEQDIDLTEYIEDSIQFITFVVEVERKFEINYPDDMLTYDCLKSMNSFAIGINEIVGQKDLNS